ncbi:hypothetical protein H1W00_13935 [Aeromicrobium sp. Marseille-Q0843]|uniref:Uncharacterized protein n=1 Tax=Aeromicrobium phoceense TaxID=2754045 RepID=A0A838XHM1_9ACTN|nr:hypothetical protein [Aeromicrobium phoceense]MBA4609582.1 hypothetical protein [Aeromicrobium phoceense]
MNGPKKTLATALTAGVLALGLGACGQSQEEKEAAACDALDDLGTTLTEVGSTLTPESTVEQWRDARFEVRKAIEKAEDKVDEADEAAWEEVDDAWERFEDGVQTVDGDATVPEARASLGDDFNAVQSARERAASGLSC